MTRYPAEPVSQKEPVFRDEKWTRSANGRPCDICGSVGTTVWCHDQRGHTGGMGLQPDDRYGYFGCDVCHAEQHANPETTLAWDKLTRALFNMSSPDVLRDAWRAFVRVLMEGRYEEWRK